MDKRGTENNMFDKMQYGRYLILKNVVGAILVAIGVIGLFLLSSLFFGFIPTLIIFVIILLFLFVGLGIGMLINK